MRQKWHLGFFKTSYTPTFRGFSSFYGYYEGSEDYYKHTIGTQATGATFHGKGFAMYDGLGNRAGKPPQAEAEADQGRTYSLPVPAWNASGVYSTELWGNVAVQLIQQHDFERDPFFMYLAFQAPHAPVQPSPDKALNDKCKTLTTNSMFF